MLTASASTPNMQRRKTRIAPKPDNWHGVSTGLQLAKQAFQNKRLEEAEIILREVLELAPDETKAWAWLSKVLQQLGNNTEANQCLNQAKTLLLYGKVDVKTPVSKTLAKILWQQGDHKTARAMLSILLLQSPDDAQLKTWQKDWRVEEI